MKSVRFCFCVNFGLLQILPFHFIGSNNSQKYYSRNYLDSFIHAGLPSFTFRFFGLMPRVLSFYHYCLLGHSPRITQTVPCVSIQNLRIIWEISNEYEGSWSIFSLINNYIFIQEYPTLFAAFVWRFDLTFYRRVCLWASWSSNFSPQKSGCYIETKKVR